MPTIVPPGRVAPRCALRRGRHHWTEASSDQALREVFDVGVEAGHTSGAVPSRSDSDNIWETSRCDL